VRYRAFISYSHADARWARWLIHKLEGYRVPSRLVGTVGEHGPVGPTLGAFFRDREELTATGDLGATLRAALAESQALVLVCSPAAARSRWVNAEVETFRASGRGERVLCFLVDGEPGSTDEASACFPPAMRNVDASGEVVEPMAADARPHADGREAAFLKLVAGLLGVPYDMLAQREAQRRQKRLMAVAAASMAGMAIALSLAFTAYVARNDAQRRQAQAEDIVGFMLGDLREKLTTVGRLDLMRTVDDKATGYFASLDPRDLSDQALEEQARSLTGIGQVRLEEGNHAAATAAFNEAHSRSSALLARAPNDGQRLFDLAQSEYWIGFVALSQNRYEDAGTWLGRYRDSAIRLAAMDRNNMDWQREVAYGHQNLAVLDERLGRYAEAEKAIGEELVLLHLWVEQEPADTARRAELANAISWMGALASRQGRLDEAAALFAQETDGYAENRRLEPENPGWVKDWIIARLLLTNTQAWLGQLPEARAGVEEAATLAQALSGQDPSNQSWQVLLGQCLWWRASLDPDPERAEASAREAERLFAKAHAAAPDESRALQWLGRTRNHLGQQALERGDFEGARVWLSRAHDALEPAWRKQPGEKLRVALAGTETLLGELAQRTSDAANAKEAWIRAEQLLTEDNVAALPFERLDPLARVLTHMARLDEAHPHLQRLRASRYQPLHPWPAPPSDPIVAGP
jgi:tetratricopeptide (TPR) repeat protein